MTAPGRNSRGGPSSRATTVNSTPTAQGPPSSPAAAAAPVSSIASPKVVGLGRPERLADGATIGRPKPAQRFERERMVRRPHRDRVEPGARQIADRLGLADREHQGQWPRPEGPRQPFRPDVEARDPPGRLHVCDMGDEGIESRPALGLEHRRDGGRVGGRSGKAVDRLGRQDDQPPLRERRDSRVDVRGIDRAHARMGSRTTAGLPRPWRGLPGRDIMF